MFEIKKSTLSCITAAMLTLSLTGCSSIFGENDRVVHINSVPKGAKSQ